MGFMDKVKDLFSGRGGPEAAKEDDERSTQKAQDAAEALKEPGAEGPGGAAPTTTPTPTEPAETPPGDDAPPPGAPA